MIENQITKVKPRQIAFLVVATAIVSMAIGATLALLSTSCPPPWVQIAPWAGSGSPLGVCLNPPPGGHCPQCAKPAFVSGQCYVASVASGCECYEGQTRSCTTSTSTPQWCETPGPSCGVQYCMNNGTTWVWDTTCHTF